MAINTQSVSQLITDFRALKAKDAISPESLGYILQRLADLLATAGNEETVAKIQQLLEGFIKAGTAVTSIQQSTADRNHIYATIGKLNLSNGTLSSTTGILIQQATTERAGAMRAQQVTDLNNARRDVNDIRQDLRDLTNTIDNILTTLDKTATSAQISCEVVNGTLHILGANKLINEGYVPYIFRSIRKRNQFKDARRPELIGKRRYCKPTKGWSLFGSVHTMRLVGSEVQFSTISHGLLSNAANTFSTSPDNLTETHTNVHGQRCVGWGRTSIILTDRKRTDRHERMIRLRYAIGFAPRFTPARRKITPADLVSNMAEFTLIYNPATQHWTYGRP